MDRARSKNQALLKLSLLAALVGSAGCTYIPSVSAPSAGDERTAALPAPGEAADESAKFPRIANVATADATEPADVDPASYADLWDRIRAGFGLLDVDSPYVARHERWFANNPDYVETMVNRARLYLYYIVEEVEKRGMPMEIALLPAIESGYQPHAYSRARAVGLWQFIPSTGRLYGLKANWWYDGRRDVLASTQAALDYLEKLNKDFDGDWQLALAAYNCGENKVMRLMAQNRRRGLPDTYAHLNLPRETRNYVPKLMAMVNIVRDPARYGLQLASIPNSEYFARVETGSQIDLGVVAKLTDTPVTELYHINPGYSRWITDPNGPHELLVPTEKKDLLLAGLDQLPEAERVQWSHHRVQRGDTLSEVAHRYRVSIAAIKTANQLHSNLLRIGQDLLIPVSTSKLAHATAPRAPSVRQTATSTPQGRVRIVHRVRSGDTLWSIAKRYRVYVHQLKQWNLLDSSVLQLGQKLSIWTRGGPSAALDVTPHAPSG